MTLELKIIIEGIWFLHITVLPMHLPLNVQFNIPWIILSVE